MAEKYAEKGLWDYCGGFEHDQSLWVLKQNNKPVRYEFETLDVLTGDFFDKELSSLIKQPDKEYLDRQRKQLGGLLNVANITQAYFFYQISVADGLTRNYVAGGEDIETILKAADIPYKVWYIVSQNHYYYELQ